MLAAAGLTASAQTSPVKFGLRAGATFPKLSISEDAEGAVKMSTSFYVGGTVDFSLNEMFSLQPGLTVLGKGTKLKISQEIIEEDFEGTLDGTGTVHLLYVEVPLNIVARFPVGNGKLFVGAGPYYAMGINGEQKIKATITVGDQAESDSGYEDLEFGKDGDYKRSDVGLNFLAGYELSKGINIQAGYGLGLTNINQQGNVTIKNNVLSVGLGYRF